MECGVPPHTHFSARNDLLVLRLEGSIERAARIAFSPFSARNDLLDGMIPSDVFRCVESFRCVEA